VGAPLDAPAFLDTLGIHPTDTLTVMNSPRFWLGVALVVIGGVWFGQGMGWIAGSAMTGVTLWAIVGPLLALVGIALAVGAARRARR
jgi:ABC-type glucose/galactose transport system permease subunit